LGAGKNIGGGAEWSEQFSNVAYLFQMFSAKNLYYTDMHVQQTIFRGYLALNFAEKNLRTGIQS